MAHPKVLRTILIGLCLAFSTAACVAQNDMPALNSRFDPTPLIIPAVAKTPKRPVTSMDLLTIRDLHGIQISPDSKSVAFVVGEAVYESNSYRSGLFVVSTDPGSVPVSLGSAGPPEWDHLGEWDPEDPKWSPDSRFIARRMQTQGVWQVFRWERTGGAPLQLTKSQYDVKEFHWSPDGHAIFFTISKPPAPAVAGTMEEHGILYDGWIRPWTQRSIVQEEMGRIPVEEEQWVVDLNTYAQRRMLPSDQPEPEGWQDKLGDRFYNRQTFREGKAGSILGAKLSPDGKNAAYTVWVKNSALPVEQSVPLYLKQLSGQPATRLSDGAVYVGDYWWSEDSRQVFFVESRADGRSRTLLVAPAEGGSPRQLAKGKIGETLNNFSVDRNVTVAACTYSNNQTPAQVAIVDLKTGAVRILVDVNPEFQNLALSPATRMEWTNKYGFRDFGYLVKPLNYKEGTRYPLIVTTYRSGDGFLRGGTGDEYPIQLFAANGFAVLAFDAKMPNSKPGDFDSTMLRFRSPLANLEQALHTLEEEGIIDPKRTGITGLSYGSEILGYAISHSGLFQTAVGSSVGGGWDAFLYYMSPNALRTFLADWGLRLPDGETAPRWREISLAANADKVQAPLLVNAADAEYFGDLQAYTTMLELGKPVEMFVYPNELHIKYQPKHRYEIYNRNTDWFNFWLQSKEEDNPQKQDQYARWRKLRDLHEEDMKKQTAAQTSGE